MLYSFPPSLLMPNVYGNMPTVGILALGLVCLCFSLSACPLQVCLSSFREPCVWIHSSHAIWCQQAPSATLIHSINSPDQSAMAAIPGRARFRTMWRLELEKSPHETMLTSNRMNQNWKKQKLSHQKLKGNAFNTDKQKNSNAVCAAILAFIYSWQLIANCYTFDFG